MVAASSFGKTLERRVSCFGKGLKLFDHEFFCKQFRMTNENLQNLLTVVTPRILKSLLRREAVGPIEKP